MNTKIFSFFSFQPLGKIFSENLGKYIPTPVHLNSYARSTLLAAAIGGSYGLIGRVVKANVGISPLNYALWFALAFQIKQCIHHLEGSLTQFMKLRNYLHELENVIESDLDLEDQIRYHSWKVIHLKNKCLMTVDNVFCAIFHIRPYMNVDEKNVQQASFLEMCRFRIWKVFKSTVMNSATFSLAYRLTKAVGFSLPLHTAVPLFIVMNSIINQILFVPALHIYARFCTKLVNDIGAKDHEVAEACSFWARRFLPPL